MNRNICLIMQGNANWIGGVEYISNLLYALHVYRQKESMGFRLSLVVSKMTDVSVLNSLKAMVDNVYFEEDVIPRYTSYIRLLCFIKRILFKDPYPLWRKFFKKNKIDCVYPFNALTSKKSATQTIAWIFDFQHKYLPHYFKPWEITARDNGFVRIAVNTSKIVVSSKAAQDDFSKFLPFAANKTHVLSFRSPCQEHWYENDPLLIQNKYHLPDRFFMVSNQFWQHKNHMLLFDALRNLRNVGCEPAVVCTGLLYDDRMPDYTNKLLQTINVSGLHNQVYLLGLIPKSDQIALMRRCITLIQPSLFEGWSTIVENARALGKTIILSDLPVHLEQNPPYSHYFKRNDAMDLARIIKDLWASEMPGPDLIKEGYSREENKQLVVDFARQFISIVN
jgi:glycosyltransferase involved in cell wall biosynthesis